MDLAVVLAAGAVGVAALWPRRTARPLWLLAVGGLVFEAFHLGEHLTQTAYWALHPQQPPWLTPWAASGRDVLALAVDGPPPAGNELLHLLGNAVFLAAVAAALAVVQRGGAGRRAVRPLRLALVLQGVHVAEHVVLTATWFAGGQALGVTTLFGLWAPDDPRLWAVRVWTHLVLNVAATVPAFVGAIRAGLWRPTDAAPRAAPTQQSGAGVGARR